MKKKILEKKIRINYLNQMRYIIIVIQKKKKIRNIKKKNMKQYYPNTKIQMMI